MASEREVTRPFWWPDARGVMALGVYVMAFVVVIISACNPTLMSEQLWVQIVTAIVLTAFIGLVLQFWFGSSKGSADNAQRADTANDKLIEAVTTKDEAK